MADCGTLQVVADFDPSSVSVSCDLQSAEVTPGGTATVQYTITNDNAADANVTLQLTANDQTVKTETRSVGRDGETSGTLDFVPRDHGFGDGDYTLDLDIQQAESQEAGQLVADGGSQLQTRSGGCNCGH